MTMIPERKTYIDALIKLLLEGDLKFEERLTLMDRIERLTDDSSSGVQETRRNKRDNAGSVGVCPICKHGYRSREHAAHKGQTNLVPLAQSSSN